MINEQLSSRNIVITGASSGIGRECAVECSKQGANLLLIGRNISTLNETLHALSPGMHQSLVLDLSLPEEIEPLLIDKLKQFGLVEGFIHSAGYEKTTPFDYSRPSIFRDIFNVNVFSGFEISRILANKKFLSPNGASFIFIASVMGIVGQAGKVAYCASKGALVSGIRSMALELAKKKIRVNSISPAVVETPLTSEMFENLTEESIQSIRIQHPLGLGKPSDISKAAVFLLSDQSRWVTGSNMVIDGGYSIQ